ncbi:MAG TPA: 3'-5' exonuclease [Ktedonobacteraceae bacterium]
MVDDIRVTQDFDTAFRSLPAQKQAIIKRKVEYLAQNPQHPSLNVHRVKQADGQIWECYIDQGMRLLYEAQQGILRLWYLGGHAIVERARQLSFNRSSLLLTWGLKEMRAVAPELPTGRLPAGWKPGYAQRPQAVRVSEKESNYFAYFREAQLRMLGVPEGMVSAVKDAETLEDVLALPGLPAHAQEYMLDVATSPNMRTVLFNPSQLLYRTRLDRLAGYFEGRIKKLMLNLESDQQQYVDMRNVPLHLLKGTAGCGKTTIGIYRAIRLAEEGRRVLLVTYGRTLTRVTKRLVEEIIGPLPADLEVKTAHSVMLSVLGARFKAPTDSQITRSRRLLGEALREVRASEHAQVLKRDETFFSEEIHGVMKGLGLGSVEAYKAVRRYGRKTALGPAQREAVWKVYQVYQRKMDEAGLREWSDAALMILQLSPGEISSKLYDDIIIDEAQDLKPVDLRVLHSLVRPGGTLMVLGDAAQTLYSRGFSWVQAGISARGRTSVLRVNHRNTCQIAESAAQLIAHNELMRASNEYVDPQWTRREGPRPRLLISATSHEQIDLVYRHILDLLGDQVCRLSDIALLCPDNAACESSKKILVGNGLPAVLRTDSDFDILEEQIKVLTIHSAKGLEFPVVFLISLCEGTLPREVREAGQDEEEARLEIERQRMLCYVGMTRAADLLYLVTVCGKESRFVRELAGKIDI